MLILDGRNGGVRECLIPLTFAIHGGVWGNGIGRGGVCGNGTGMGGVWGNGTGMGRVWMNAMERGGGY